MSEAEELLRVRTQLFRDEQTEIRLRALTRARGHNGQNETSRKRRRKDH
jgi:hypothetical protein